MEELRVAGILAARGARSALVRDPRGHVHAVRVGDYVGRDFGRVEAIAPDGSLSDWGVAAMVERETGRLLAGMGVVNLLLRR